MPKELPANTRLDKYGRIVYRFQGYLLAEPNDILRRLMRERAQSQGQVFEFLLLKYDKAKRENIAA